MVLLLERAGGEEVEVGRRAGRHAAEASRGFKEGFFDDDDDNDAIGAAPWRLGAGERGKAALADDGKIPNKGARIRIMASGGLDWRGRGENW